MLRFNFYLAFLFLAASVTLSAASSVKLDRNEVEETLQDLRSSDKSEILETLRYLPDMRGYPDSAQGLIPALLWIKSRNQDAEVAQAAGESLRAIGWPEKRCLECLRQFAGRQDKIYKLMGLTALVQIAWKDPEAMTILFEITKNGRGDMGAMARAVASDLKHIDCGMQADMDRWNLAALPFMGRLQSALAGAGWQLRGLAAIVLNCSKVRDDLKRSLQDYLERVPEPRSRLTPTPVTRIY